MDPNENLDNQNINSPQEGTSPAEITPGIPSANLEAEEAAEVAASNIELLESGLDPRNRTVTLSHDKDQDIYLISKDQHVDFEKATEDEARATYEAWLEDSNGNL